MTEHIPHIKATLSHGGEVSGQPEHVARAQQIDRDMRREEAEWVEYLRSRDVKAAHPDDGWVDREKNTVHLCYPQFRASRFAVGDLIVLGTPDSWRLTRIVGFSTNRLAVPQDDQHYIHFEVINRALC